MSRKISIIITAFLFFVCHQLPVAYADTDLSTALYIKGQKLAESYQFADAINFLKEATAEDQSNTDGWLLLGTCYLSIGSPVDAQNALTNGIRVDDNSWKCHYYLGEALSAQGQYDAALKEYRRAVELNKNATEAYYGIALASLALGNRSEAKRQFLILQVVDVDDNRPLEDSSTGDDTSRLSWIIDFTNRPAHEMVFADQAIKNPSFAKFKRKLLTAVEHHDAKFINSIVHGNDIWLSLAGPVGSFDDVAKPQNKASDCWRILKQCVSSGTYWKHQDGAVIFGKSDAKDILCPYDDSAFPYTLDGLTKDYGVILGDKVPMYTCPSSSSQIVDILSHNVVIPDFRRIGIISESRDGFPKWVRVITATGKQGYVKGENIWCVFDHTVTFREFKGRWYLIAYLENAD